MKTQGKGNSARLRTLLQEAVRYEARAFDNDDDVNGSELTAFFSDWRERAKCALGIRRRRRRSDQGE